MDENIKTKLVNFFKDKDFISIAYLFGSYAKNKQCTESDIDIIVHTTNKEKLPKLNLELERLLKINLDLLLFEEAPASVIWSAIRKGVPLKIKDRNLFLDLMLSASREAEEFYNFNLDTFIKKQQRKKYAARR